MANVITLPGSKTIVIVVPDDAVMANNFRPLNVRKLEQNTFIMAQDSLRMYVRETTWKALLDSYKLTAKAKR